MAQWNAIPVWRRRVPRALAIAVVVSLALPLAAQVQERVDHDAVYQIKDEGFQRSKVMGSRAISLTCTVRGSAGRHLHEGRAVGHATVHRVGPHQRQDWSHSSSAGLDQRPVRGQRRRTQSYAVIGYAKAWTPAPTAPCARRSSRLSWRTRPTWRS